LTVSNQEGIPRLPVLHRQDTAKRHLGLERRARADYSEPVTYAVNVDIHTNGGSVESDSEDEIGRFATDSRKFA